MRVQPGMRFGPYEIGRVLGVGGMGEVYSAKDTRLGRDVAIKVLSAELVQDPSFRARLQQEAKSAARLNHPNAVAVYDVGEDYIVSEYVEGVTLRNMEKPSPRQALEIAAQVAEGLAAAHAVGIVHRDIKPENIMLTPEGRVKILDFGLAKPIAASAAAAGAAHMTLTQPGMVIGTVHYMSPEQVRGAQVDHRSDIFSLGLVLYEMLAGKKAFGGDSAPEVMSAILKEDPPPLPGDLPPAVAIVLSRCLEKEPARRFQSAHDLAVGLRALSTPSQTVATTVAPTRTKSRRWIYGLLILLVALAAGVAAGRWAWRNRPVSYRQVTFQHGDVSAARFGAQEGVVVYSARWHEQPADVFLMGVGSPEARSLGLTRGHLFSISTNNEMAVGLNCRYEGDNSRTGTLVVSPLYGGAPRTVMPEVSEADWDPAGAQLAVVRRVGAWHRLEYPAGTVLYQTAGWLGDLRFSPRGDRIAFSDHTTRNDDRGRVAAVDLHGKFEPLSKAWESIEGLVWTRDGSEVWYAASASGYADTIYAVSPANKKTRLVTQFPVSVKLLDFARDGRLMFVTCDSDLHTTWARLPGSERDRNIDWLGPTYPADMSADGKTLLFSQYGEAGGSGYGVYVRKLGDPMPIRLGEGDGIAMSPDGKYALALQYSEPPRLVLFQYQAAAPVALPSTGMNYQPLGQWFPDGRRILFEGNEKARPARLWVQDVPEGRPRAITPEGTELEGAGLKPDGTAVAARPAGGVLRLYPVESGSPADIPGLQPEDRLVRWSPDGKKLLVMVNLDAAVRLDEVEVATGRRTQFKEIASPPSASAMQFTQMLVSSDGQTIVYGADRRVRTLRVAEGLK